MRIQTIFRHRKCAKCDVVVLEPSMWWTFKLNILWCIPVELFTAETVKHMVSKRAMPLLSARFTVERMRDRLNYSQINAFSLRITLCPKFSNKFFNEFDRCLILRINISIFFFFSLAVYLCHMNVLGIGCIVSFSHFKCCCCSGFSKECAHSSSIQKIDWDENSRDNKKK